MKNTIILTVRIDYTHTGKDEQHELTAAGLVINNQFPTIEQGVEIEHVEAYNNGVEIMSVYK